MRVLDVRCAHCRARIDVAVGTRFEVCAFCGAQLEFTGGPERTLEPRPVTVKVLQVPTSKPGPVSQCDLADVQKEIESLDVNWDIQRQQLLTQGKDGSTVVPDVGFSIAVGMAIILAGLIWTLIVGTLAESHNYSKVYTLSGVLFVMVAVQFLARGVRRAQRYEDAFHLYRDRRIDLHRSISGRLHARANL